MLPNVTAGLVTRKLEEGLQLFKIGRPARLHDSADSNREALVRLRQIEAVARRTQGDAPGAAQALRRILEVQPKALETRRERAARVLELDDAVTAAVKELKSKGFESPYLRAFVVARINPLRF